MKPPKKINKSSAKRGAVVIERILKVTLDELARVGFHQLSVSEVANRARVNKTSVYRRWPTKEALIHAALRSVFLEETPVPDTGRLMTDMLAYAHGVAIWVESSVGRGVTRMLFAAAGDRRMQKRISQLTAAASGGPAKIFQRARKRGELAQEADTQLALMIIAGALFQRVFVENEKVTSSFLKRLITFVLAGLSDRDNHRRVLVL